MANTTLIKGNPEFTAYDTDSGDVSVTLSSVTGKTYQVFNKGTSGNKLTVTYGSDSMIFEDGDSGVLTYDGANWATQFSTVGGPVSLTPGRISDDEKSTVIPSSGDYVIAVVDDVNAYDGATAEIICEFGNNMLGVEVSFVSSAVAKTTENTTFRLIKPGKSNLTGNRVTGFSLAKNDTDQTAGAKVIAHVVTTISTLALNVHLASNFARPGKRGWQLIEATTTDNDKTPDGSAATYIEAKQNGVFPDGVELTPGRISDDERDYHALTTSGWWTFAESEAISYDVLSCTIRGTMIGGGAGHTATLNLEFTDSNTTKEDKSSFAYMTAPSYEGTPYVAYRYVYRTAVGGGVKLQVWAPPISVSFKGKLISNFSKDIPGMKLVTPYLDNSPNVPAGTAGTTKEAGAEWLPQQTTTRYPYPIIVYVDSVDRALVCVPWGQVPKQDATTVEINYTLGNLVLRGGGVAINIYDTFIESAPIIEGNNVYFNITKTAGFPAGMLNHTCMLNGYGKISIKLGS